MPYEFLTLHLHKQSDGNNSLRGNLQRRLAKEQPLSLPISVNILSILVTALPQTGKNVACVRGRCNGMEECPPHTAAKGTS